MTLFLVTAGEYLGFITSPYKVTSIHRSRHALFPSYKYFGLYHALTYLYPSRHALIITKHLKNYRVRPHRAAVRSLQPAIDLRSRQVSLQILTCLYSFNVARPPDFAADAFMGTSYQTNCFRVITCAHVARLPNLTDNMFMGTCCQTKYLRAVTRPHTSISQSCQSANGYQKSWFRYETARILEFNSR